MLKKLLHIGLPPIHVTVAQLMNQCALSNYNITLSETALFVLKG